MLNIMGGHNYYLFSICVLTCLSISTIAMNTKDNSDAILYNEHGDNASLRRSERGLNNLLIAPNTRWCGKGTTADEYNNLGGASAADKCCRAHDHCKHYIPAMGTRYDFFNYHLYTLSHCQCDRRFRTCLKMANDDDANAIGQLFFNVAQMRCFVLRSEKVCRQRDEDGVCQRMESKLKAYIRDIERY